MTSPSSRRRTWTPQLLLQLAMVLAVLVAGITGAGLLRSRDQKGDVLQIVQAASTSVERQHTFRTSFRFSIDGSGLTIVSKGELLVDTVRKLSTGTVEAPGVGTLTLLSSGGEAYFQLPGGKTDAAGHHWVSFPSASGAETAIGGQDPLSMLKLLSNPKGVRRVGSEKINGVDTTHYSVVLDPQRLLDTVAKNPAAPSILPGTLTSLKDGTMSVWVDDQKLPRRLQMQFAVSTVKAAFSFDYSDFGGPVDVTVPPAADVTRLGSPQELGPTLLGLHRS